MPVARWRGCVALACAVAVASACSGTSSPRQAAPTTRRSGPPTTFKQGGALRIGISEPTGIAPGTIRDTDGDEIGRLINVGLLAVDAHLQPIPGVASSWETGADAKVFTFHLRRDARFSTGRPITARDFVFAFRRLADPDTASTSGADLHIVGWDAALKSAPDNKIGDVALPGVRAIDDYTLEIRTSEPQSFLPSRVADTNYAAVPPELFASSTDGHGYNNHPIGDGPYVMQGSWQHNQVIRLVRNDRYWGAPGLADTIEARIFASTETEFRETEAGNLDLSGVPPGQEDAARSEFGDRYYETPTAVLEYIVLPLYRPGFADTNLRHALSLAIDRDAVAKRLLSGTALAADSVVPPVTPEAKRDSCPDCRYDPRLARELYRRSAGIPGNKMTAYYPAGAGFDDVAKVIGNEIHSTLGINIVFQPTDAGPLFTIANKHQLEGPAGLGWAASFLSAYEFLAPLFETGAPDNDSLYSNPKFDALMDKARGAQSFAEAKRYLGEAQDIIGADMPAIPLMFPSTIRVSSTRVANVITDAASEVRLDQVAVTG